MKKYFGIAVLLVSILMMSACGSSYSGTSSYYPSSSNSSSSSSSHSNGTQAILDAYSNAKASNPDTPLDQSTDKSDAEVSTASIGEQNAVRTAKDYLEFAGMSYSGLIEQLEYEGYSTEEATYGADHSGADWNQEAADAANDYMAVMSFSRQGLIEQLLYEGFTQEQAEYGAASVGY